MRLSKILFYVMLISQPFKNALGLSEQQMFEEQNLRKPQALDQNRSSELLSMLKNEVRVERPKASAIPLWSGGTNTSFVEGNEFSQLLQSSCLADEEQYEEIERSLLVRWMKNWKSQNSDEFMKLVSENASLDYFLMSGKKSLLDEIEVIKWNKPNQEVSKTKFSNELKNYLKSFTSIDDFDLVTLKYLSPKKDRGADLVMKNVFAEIKFDLRGYISEVRRQDRGSLFVNFTRDQGEWKISKIEIADMVSLQNKKMTFQETTASSGINNLISYPRIEAIRRGGYALALSDYDGDGNTDMYVGAYGPGQLFKGVSDGRFAEVKDSGIDQLTYVKSAVWADFDNDKLKDLLIVRFVPSEEANKNVQRSLGDNYFKRTDIIIYKNLGSGKFKRAAGIVSSERTDYAMPSAVADFNNDGLLDFYIGYPGHKDFTTFTNYFEEKKSMKAQGIYINSGDLKFNSQSMSDLKSENFEAYANQNRIFPHSAMAVDFNQDGKVDIVVIDDRGNISPAYINIGGGKFTQANYEFKIKNEGYGMGIGSGDIDNDGLTDLIMTNVKFNSAQKIRNSCKANWDIDLMPNVENDLIALQGRMVNGKKTFLNLSNEIGLDDLGEGLGALEFIDYNNDGHEDIYVVNGLWSGTNKFEDLSNDFSKVLAKRYNDSYFSRALMESRDSTQSTIMQILANYQGNVDLTQSKERLSLAGFQRNRLFRNNGDGTFVEVGFLEGVDSIADGYVVAKADLNKDGRLDLVLRNADPGSLDVYYSPVQIFMNQTKRKNSLRLKLVGSKSNRDAIGALVVLEVKTGVKLTKQLISNAGTSQSNLEMHFGMGESKVAKSLSIHWPSGKVTKKVNVNSGYLELSEDVPNVAIK